MSRPDHSSRSFLSADLIWGVRQSDPLGTVFYHRHTRPVTAKLLMGKPRSRFLSENPSTYLR